MIIKVCGMREVENIREVEALGIDLMGFIFWPKSKRFVAEPPAYLPTQAKRVGVFVDAAAEEILRIADSYALDFIQLHGSESPAFIEALSRHITPRPYGDRLRIIKAFNIATADDFAQAKAYEGLADYFLFDTKATLPGGSGQQFDWSVLGAYDSTTPFLLSGGIGPNDADRIRQAFTNNLSPLHPRLLGIDLNSRFETSPALKDVNQLREFIKKIRL